MKNSYSYMNSNNWSLVRSFLEVAQQGSLAAAARNLGVSQPTLTRDIQALETQTRLNLFKRTTRGMQLTEQGRGLMEAAKRMGDAAQQFNRQAAGLSTEIKGEVRISANEVVGTFLLPHAIKALREQHPQLQVEIVIANQVSSLSKREADIALRMFRPTQPELVSRRLPDMALGFFAHHDYIEKYGEPKTIAEFKQHSVINADEDREFIEGASAMGYTFVREDFPLRTDHLLTQINLARAGAGIVGTHIKLAQQWPELKQVLIDFPLPALEFWLVCHGDVQYNTRIRTSMQFLAKWFADDPYHGMLS